MKVLIVEDERRAARAISHMVNQHPECTVVGMAGNGEEAMTYLRQMRVDLVLTDIRMPLMGGVQLMESIYQEFPSILIVVLSGYSQFDYAKAALQYRAFDYLLKPISQEDLFRMLDQAVETLSSRKRTKQQLLLQQALSGALQPKDADQLVHLGLVVCGQPDSAAQSTHLWLRPEQEQWLNQCFGRSAPVYTRISDNTLLFLFPFSSTLSEQITQYVQCLQQHTDYPIHLIYTRNTTTLSQVKELTQQLSQILLPQLTLFRSQFGSVDSFTAGVRQTPPGNLLPERAADALLAQNREQLRTELQQTLSVISAGTGLLDDMLSYLLAILGDSRIAFQLSASQMEQTRRTAYQILLSAAEAGLCAEILADYLLQLNAAPTHKRSAAETVEEIAQYLETHYRQSQSVDLLARQFNLTPSYLNKIFKQIKGVRPTEYLLSIRMARARQILEASPNALVKDVANSVGYTDPNYFSKVFKRATGLWPTECQKKTE